MNFLGMLYKYLSIGFEKLHSFSCVWKGWLYFCSKMLGRY